MSFGTSERESSSRVFEAQAPFLEDLYSRARALVGAQAEVGPRAEALAGELLPGATGSVAALSDIATGRTAAQEAMAARLGTSNPYLTAVIDAAGEDITRNLGREYAAIGGEAAGVGGAFGGSRHGIREGMAAEAATREMGRISSDLRYADYASQPAVAESLLRTQVGAATRVPGASAATMNLGLSPYGAAWSPVQNYAAALGRPTVLGESSGSSFSLALPL